MVPNSLGRGTRPLDNPGLRKGGAASDDAPAPREIEELRAREGERCMPPRSKVAEPKLLLRGAGDKAAGAARLPPGRESPDLKELLIGTSEAFLECLAGGRLCPVEVPGRVRLAGARVVGGRSRAGPSEVPPKPDNSSRSIGVRRAMTMAFCMLGGSAREAPK